MKARGPRARHVHPHRGHRLLETFAVLGPSNRLLIGTYQPNPVALQDPALGHGHRAVQSGLAAQIGQQRVGTFFLDDPDHRLEVQRLDVGHVGRTGIGHDGRGIRVNEHDLVTQASQRFTGLRAGVVELAGLTDHDGTGADDHDFVNVGSSRHRRFRANSYYG